MRCAGRDPQRTFVTLRDGPPPHPADATLTTGPGTFYALATGASALASTGAEAQVDGDRDRLADLLGQATVAPMFG